MELLRAGFPDSVERPAKLIKLALRDSTSQGKRPVLEQVLSRLERDAKIRSMVLAASPTDTTHVARAMVYAMSGSEDLHGWSIRTAPNISFSEQLDALSGAIWKTTMRMIARIRGIAYVDQLCGKRSANFDSGIVMEDRRRVYHFASHIRLLRTEIAPIIGDSCAIPLAFADAELMNTEDFCFYRNCLCRWLERLTELFDALSYECVRFLTALPKPLLSSCTAEDVAHAEWRFADKGGTELRIVECDKCVFQAHKNVSHLLLWDGHAEFEKHYSHMRTKIKKQSVRAPARKTYREAIADVMNDLKNTAPHNDLYMRLHDVVTDAERIYKARTFSTVCAAVNEAFSFVPFGKQMVDRQTTHDGMAVSSPNSTKVTDRADIPMPGDVMGTLTSMAFAFPMEWDFVPGHRAWNPTLPPVKEYGRAKTLKQAENQLARLLTVEPNVHPASTFWIEEENAPRTVFAITKKDVSRISGAQYFAEQRFQFISAMLGFAQFSGHYRMKETHPLFVKDNRREWPTAFYFTSGDVSTTFPKSSHAVFENGEIGKFYVTRGERDVLNDTQAHIGSWKDAHMFRANGDLHAKSITKNAASVEYVGSENKSFFNSLTFVHPDCFSHRTFPCYLFCAIWSQLSGQHVDEHCASIPIICVEADQAARFACKTVTDVLRTLRKMIEAGGGLPENGLFHHMDFVPVDQYVVDPRAMCYAPLGGWSDGNDTERQNVLFERYVDRFECPYNSPRGRLDGKKIMIPLMHPRLHKDENADDGPKKIEVTLSNGEIKERAYKCNFTSMYARPFPLAKQWGLQPTSHPFAMKPGSFGVFQPNHLACGDDIRAWSQLQTTPFYFAQETASEEPDHEFLTTPTLKGRLWLHDEKALYAIINGEFMSTDPRAKSAWLPLSGVTLVQTREHSLRASFVEQEAWEARGQLDKVLAEHIGREKWILKTPDTVRAEFLRGALFGTQKNRERYARETSEWALEVVQNTVNALMTMANETDILQETCEKLKEETAVFCEQRSSYFEEAVSVRDALEIVRDAAAVAAALVSKTVQCAANTMQACWTLHTIVLNAFQKNIEHHEHEAIACVINISNALRCSMRARPADEDVLHILEPYDTKLLYLETRKTKDATTNERDSLARATAQTLDIHAEGLLHFRHMRDWAFSSALAEKMELIMRPPHHMLVESTQSMQCNWEKWNFNGNKAAHHIQNTPGLTLFSDRDLHDVRYVSRLSIGDHVVRDDKVTLFTSRDQPKKMFIYAECDIETAPYTNEQIDVRVSITQVLATYEFNIAPFEDTHSEWTTTDLRHKGRYWCHLTSVKDENDDARVAYAVIAISATKFQKCAALGIMTHL